MPAASSPPEWYVISLRPRGEHGPMRRAAARHGAGVIALSPWMLRPRDDAPSRAALRNALAAPKVVFTSPAAAQAAAALQPLRPRPGQEWFAVGEGTAIALRRAGVMQVFAPQRMDSEGLLALAGLQTLAATAVGLVTAPGGRGTLTPALQARGAQVVRADVYERVPVVPGAGALARLRALARPAVLAVSSGEALQLVLSTVPGDVATRLRTLPVAAASDRLAILAGDLGFAHRVRARSARPQDMADAARAALR